MTEPFTPALRDAILRALYAPLDPTCSAVPVPDIFGWTDRINTPATVTDDNWTWRLPWPVDRLHEEEEAIPGPRHSGRWRKQAGEHRSSECGVRDAESPRSRG